MATHEPDSRPLLLGGPALGLRLILFAAMAGGLMVADHRQHHLAKVRDWMSVAVYPLQWAVQAPVQVWAAARESFATRTRVEAENVTLAANNLVLRLKLMRFESLEQENRRLREARESSSRVVQRTMVAEIVRVDLDPFRQRVLINKGTRDGVFRGQAALDANGIFGQVTRAGPVSAEVILITDPEHAIPVQVNRTGARSIALGTGRPGLLSLPYLPQNADVIAGDLLVSSGLGGVYPPGYPVGRVTEVVRDTGQPLMAVAAEPLAALDRDPEVLLAWFDREVVEPEDEAESAAGLAPASASTPSTTRASTPVLAPVSTPAASSPAPPAPEPVSPPAQEPDTTPVPEPTSTPPEQEPTTTPAQEPAAPPPGDEPAGR